MTAPTLASLGTNFGLQPLKIPALSTRRHELDRIIDEYAHDAERLELLETAITDQALDHLAAISSLDYFAASGPGISATGLAKLRTKMSSCWQIS